MARCPKCRKHFATLEDEADMHDCPRCGYSRDDDEREREAQRRAEDENDGRISTREG
jgi:DNA-directed RNA polymerase subunit M/transcription elongation factor TFIIS